MSKIRTPLRYPGSKVGLSQKLVDLIPPHKIYVEAFGGTGALLFTKKPSEIEVYNDIDSNLVNFFKILKDGNKFQKLYRNLLLTPYSREEFYFCRDNLTALADDTEYARRFFVVNRQSYSGTFKNWSFNFKALSGKFSKILKAYWNMILLLPQLAERLADVCLENRDFVEVIEIYDSPETFFYLDPPYVLDTRKSKKLYNYEMTDAKHKQLVDILLGIKGKFMLSGYYNKIYTVLEDKGVAQRVEFEVLTTLMLKKEPIKPKARRIECVWINYELEKVLYI